MVPRSRVIVFGTIASLLMAVGCKNETQVTPTGDDGGRITRASKAPTKGGAFKGTVNFGGAITPDKSTVSLVDEKLLLITFAGKAKPDTAGKFVLKPAPTRVYFVLVEGEKQKMLGAVLPVDSKDPNEEPTIAVNAATTLAVAGVIGAFDPARGGQYQLEDLPVDLFNELVAAIAVTNPTLDFTKDPREHGGQFTKLYDTNTSVKTAYDALFGELRARFEKRNPGLPLPTTSLPPADATPSPNATASGGSGLATPSPSLSPSATPSGAVGSTPPSTDVSTSPSAEASTPASVAPSLAPRTFDPLKHVMATVVGDSEDGLPIAVNGGNHHFPAKLTVTNPLGGTVDILAIPDGDRLLMTDNLSEKFRFSILGDLLKAQPADPAVAVADVNGAAADGTTLMMVGSVAGAPSLIKVTVNFPALTTTATAMPLTGDEVPGVVTGHALHGGSLYVSSSGQHRIYKIDIATGATTRFTGAGIAATPLLGETPIGTAVYNTPGGLLTLGDFLFVSEVETHRILRINMITSTVEPYAGANTIATLVSGPPANARFQRPNSLFPDSLGRFLVADRTNGTIRRIDPDADPNKAEVLHYVTVDGAGANPNAAFLQFFQGVGKCGEITFAIDTQGKLRKLTPKL